MTAKINKEAYLKFLGGDFGEFHGLDEETKNDWLANLKGEFVNLQGKLTAVSEEKELVDTELVETKTKLESTQVELAEKISFIEDAQEGLNRLAELETTNAEAHRVSVINKVKEQYEGKGFILSEEKSTELEAAETNVLELELLFLEGLEVNPDLLKSEPNQGEEKDTDPNDAITEGNENKNKFSKESLLKELQSSLGKR